VLGTPQTGDRIGRFLLTDRLGQGGMGVVFAARDTSLERDVAIKVIGGDLADDPEFRERFRREAVAMSRIDSPHIVAVHDHGEHAGRPYLVTRLVRGGDLAALLARGGRLAPDRALALTEQVLDGLADAHAAGIVHRDIKPSNVLVDADGERAYLCDFGIATMPGAELTRTGSVVGSFPYMAPERHSGESATTVQGPAGDVYAVGCLLWAMLTGTAPYVGTDVEVAMGHLHGPIPQVVGRDRFATALNQVLRTALAKDPHKRYASAAAMRAAVAQARAVAPDHVALPAATAVRQRIDLPQPGGVRRPLALAITSLVAVAAIVVAVVALTRGSVPTAVDALTGSDATTSASPSAHATRRVVSRQGASDRAPRSRAPHAAPPSAATTARRHATAGAVASKARPSVTTRRSGPRPVAPTSKAAVDHYQCWNGTKVVHRGDCTTLPTGLAGARWVFSGLKDLSCRPSGISHTTDDLESYTCPYDGGNYITVTRWRTATSAESHWKWTGSPGTAWQCGSGGYVCGRKIFKVVRKTGRFHTMRWYTFAPYWSVWIDAKSNASRQHGITVVGNAVDPRNMSSQPLS